MFKRVLIANRGAVAARILRCLHEMNIEAVVVHSPVDADLPYVAQADAAVALAGNRPAESYLDQDAIIAAARQTGADAIHPGYGFLSENAAFARRVEAEGIAFIGPSADSIEAMGEKTAARRRMAEAGLPMVPSSALLGDDEAATLGAADAIGYPLLVKPANGGGGIGMMPVRDRSELLEAVQRARTISARAFADVDIYLERLLEQPRHIEFQIAADAHGAVKHLFERDCSLQRRHQKVIEEAGAPGIPRAELNAMAERVAAAVGRVGYRTIGTVEMLHHPDTGFSFLEMNTRLQVEHGVTEEVTGIDLVATQIRLAAGAPLGETLALAPSMNGHAIEARIYAEDPMRFLPSPGRLERFRMPADGVRVETGYAEGCTVSPFYDPMVAKVIAHGADRTEAIERLLSALRSTEIAGIKTNLPSLISALDSPRFRGGAVHTGVFTEIGKAA